MPEGFLLSHHARVEMERRGIDADAVAAVLRQPDQIVSGHYGLRVYQSRISHDAREYLLRVIVNNAVLPATVVTMYRTSRIAKYWRTE